MHSHIGNSNFSKRVDLSIAIKLLPIMQNGRVSKTASITIQEEYGDKIVFYDGTDIEDSKFGDKHYSRNRTLFNSRIVEGSSESYSGFGYIEPKEYQSVFSKKFKLSLSSGELEVSLFREYNGTESDGEKITIKNLDTFYGLCRKSELN